MIAKLGFIITMAIVLPLAFSMMTDKYDNTSEIIGDNQVILKQDMPVGVITYSIGAIFAGGLFILALLQGVYDFWLAIPTFFFLLCSGMLMNLLFWKLEVNEDTIKYRNALLITRRIDINRISLIEAHSTVQGSIDYVKCKVYVDNKKAFIISEYVDCKDFLHMMRDRGVKVVYC